MIKIDDNMMVLAMQNYDSVHCFHLESFMEDYNRFGYVKKLLKKYHKTKEIKERLVLNHLIILYNCFGDASNTILFSIVDREQHKYLKTFMSFLDRLHDIVITLDGNIIITSKLDDDINILNKIQAI